MCFAWSYCCGGAVPLLQARLDGIDVLNGGKSAAALLSLLPHDVCVTGGSASLPLP